MMKICFDKELLLERCRTDMSNKTSLSETPLDMCEHDRSWGNVALISAARIVECELMRIARMVETILSDEQTYIAFFVDSTTDSHSQRLAEAIEGYLTAKVCEAWAMARGLSLDFGSTERIGFLKHLTLKKG